MIIPERRREKSAAESEDNMDFLDDLFIALRAEGMLNISPPELNEAYSNFAEKWLHNDSNHTKRDDADEEFDKVVYLAQRVAFYEGMAFEGNLSAALPDKTDNNVTAPAEGEGSVDERLIMAAIGIDCAIHGLDLAKTTLSESFRQEKSQ